MAKRFIVLVDFSDHSPQLLRYVSDWSLRTDAEVLLLHQHLLSFPSLVDAEMKMNITRQTTDDALKQLKALATAHVSEHVMVSFMVSQKALSPVLFELLKEPYEHLIFLGLKGTNTLKKWFLGSVAIDVLKTISNILVAMPKNPPATPPATLFVGIQESHPLKVSELQKLLSFFGQQLPAIHFFTIANPLDDRWPMERYLKSQVNQFSPQTMATFSIYEAENIIGFIKEMITNNPDVLMVIQRGSRMLKDHFVRQFLTNELVYDGKLPLIILP